MVREKTGGMAHGKTRAMPREKTGAMPQKTRAMPWSEYSHPFRVKTKRQGPSLKG